MNLRFAARAFALSLCLTVLCNCGGGGSSSNNTGNPPPKTQAQISLTQVASGFSNPLGLEQPNDNSGRLFVVEQGGTVRIIQNGSVVGTPFLNITSRVTSGGETGLLGLAFHPSYAQNGRFYVNYTRTNAGQLQTVVAEYTAAPANSNQVDPSTERILLIQNQPFSNHKGGQLTFGPDGLLYIGLGDGGGSGDPNGNGQNKNSLLGKMLRIGVDQPFAAGKQYAIPADNPFAGGGGSPEIFAYGFRNPWRFSFDSTTGRFFVADVGQDAFEEVDIVTNGANYGWNVMEGTHCFNPSSGCSTTGLTPPITDYPHSDGIAVIGGFVYRGALVPNLRGAYVFGDFGSGRIWMLQENGSTWTRSDVLSTGKSISTFGRDQAGELYVVDYGGGAVLQVKSAS